MLVLWGCNNSSSKKNETDSDNVEIKTTDSLAKVALRHLYDELHALPNVSMNDNAIIIGNNSIRLDIRTEFDGKKDDKWIYAANFTTVYKAETETECRAGSIGIGSTQAEAINVCLEEWFAAVGIPLTNVMKGDNSIPLANCFAYPGLMGIRGELPENTWVNGDYQMAFTILNHIQDEITPPTGGIIPIEIKLNIGATGVLDGECRIHNKVSPQILEKLKLLPWPTSYKGYLFKQFYFVKSKGKSIE
jgi:hypothetical protein